MATPDVPVGFIPVKAGEVLSIAGGIKLRIQEDGSRTENRIGAVEITIPANMSGPPAHWHEMHDETFLVLEGVVRFHIKDGQHVDAQVGDYIVVPPRCPHTFSNPTDKPAKFFNTFTPAFYVNYFKLMDTWAQEGQTMDKQKVGEAMARFATVQVKGEL